MSMRSALSAPFAGLLTLLVLASPVPAQAGRNPSRYDLGDGGLALSGYDPVAYWDEGGAAPALGLAELQAEHGGVHYRFATEAHRATFLAAPERFEPAYGGWCAYSMSLDERRHADPLAFRVARGRLFVFADPDLMQVDEGWVEHETEAIAKADTFWRGFAGEEPRPGTPGSWRPYHEFNLSGASLALQGYDPVSYFPEGGGKPTRGVAKFSARHQGVLYRFASEAHRKLFVADPGHYEPQHGGWCSYAMGEDDDKVSVDPEAFRLTDGQLHLFYNGWLGDTRDDWDDDTARLKRDADAHWSKRMAKALAPTSAPR